MPENQFIYSSYNYRIKDNTLFVQYKFELHGNETVIFMPCLDFIFPKQHFNINFNKHILDSIVFNLGMVESISYWKAVCCKSFIINNHYLYPEQINYWKQLFYYGLGEFRYLNNIYTPFDEFINIHSYKCDDKEEINNDLFLENKIIIPIGGGKDSIVCLELLKKNNTIIPFLINPTIAMNETIKVAGFNMDECVIVKRKIDETLIELNARGYLNGHTPFSAIVAFSSLIASLMTSSKYIALSNESSANESTVMHKPDDIINHQYSKTIHFENNFRDYYSAFISDKFNYFSYLRNYSELQISEIFSTLKQYHQIFRSCNVGSKHNKWCCNCPKCLFVYIMLSAFLKKDELIKIFSEDLFLNTNLQNTLYQLTGFEKSKPFECVGTISECKAAIAKYLKNNKAEGILIPYVQMAKDMQEANLSEENKENNIPPEIQLQNILYGKKILILGFGKEGQSTLDYISKFIDNKYIYIADAKESTKLLELKNKYTIYTGKDYLNNIDDFDIIIKSPGIPEKHLNNISKEKITSQTDLFLRIYHSQCIGITATKGKSTTSSLINHILSTCGYSSLLVGNIGIPPFSEIKNIKKDTIIVIELSAHQLVNIRIAPKIALLLNIYQEHLDHFGDYQKYIQAKCNILTKQLPDSTLITDNSIPEITDYLQNYCGKIIYFDAKEVTQQGNLLGLHNKSNIAAATKVAEIFNIDKLKISESIITFKALAHRLEFIGEYKKIKFYNDSISTIPEAAIAAVEAIKDVDTIILGGYDRGISYEKLCKYLLKSEINNIILMGEAGKRINNILAQMNTSLQAKSIKHASSLEEAVKISFSVTKRNSSCLLSPAASSYDSFKNFEERGNMFKKYVEEQ